MCWCISLLALACVWYKELYSTIQQVLKDIRDYLLLGTYYVLVYFSTSTSLCLGQGATFTTQKQCVDISDYLLLSTFYVKVYFSTSTSLFLIQETSFYNTETMG
ncbi:hypothetical protein DPMN_027733 [Dreissena polymorpha]|uniref:Secreted protein n=1 Tax=Dreissena polymorpha TaxID=45954 RepID=A0A9D4LVV8_DREPO|nr:hypothetical protein DPMN_027733 [Dreissena polymorpha]